MLGAVFQILTVSSSDAVATRRPSAENCADQTRPTRFLVWDRRSLVPRGGFTGDPTIDITDGVTFVPTNDDSGAAGLFYATHHDVQVVAYRWADIAEAMGLRTDCR